MNHGSDGPVYCGKCGQKIGSDVGFCPFCGVNLKLVPPRLVIRHRGEGMTSDSYSGFWRRFLAFLIDLVFIILIGAGLCLFLGLWEGVRMAYQILRGMPVTNAQGVVVSSALPTALALSFAVLIIIVPWIYFAGLEASKNQATLGKLAVRVAVTDIHGERITFLRATLRHFGKFISIITLFAGFTLIALTRQNQGLHDMIAGTLMFLHK